MWIFGKVIIFRRLRWFGSRPTEGGGGILRVRPLLRRPYDGVMKYGRGFRHPRTVFHTVSP